MRISTENSRYMYSGRRSKPHGVLAPGAKLRSEIIPGLAEHATEHLTDHTRAQGAPARMELGQAAQTYF